MAHLFDSPIWINTLLHNPKVRKSICNQQFKAFDANSNGQLEESELTSLVSKVCASMHVAAPSPTDLHKTFERFDKSKSNGLTAKEFSLFFEHLLRSSLPLMEEERPQPEADEISGCTVEQREWRRYYASKAPSFVNKPEAETETASSMNPRAALSSSCGGTDKPVTVTVFDAGGTLQWGPSDIDAGQRVAVLVEQVSRSKGSIGLELLHGGLILDPATIIATLTEKHDLELAMHVLEPDVLASEAMQALQECPTPETIGYIPSPGLASGAYNSTDQIGDDPRKNAAYMAWLDSGAQVVIDKLQAIGKVDCKDNPNVKALILACLDIPTSDMVWGNGGCESAIELYPDALTKAAVRLMPLCMQLGDTDATKICGAWFGRLFCFHGGFSFDYGDAPCSTSNIETVFEILKILPLMFKNSSAQHAIKRKLHAHASRFMSHIEDLETTLSRPEIAERRWGHLEAHEWKLEHAYNALMNLTDEKHPSHKYNNPWWAERGFYFPDVKSNDIAHEDETWMNEYMYKRMNKPQEGAFRQS